MSEVAHNLDKKQEVSEKWLPVVGYEGLYEVSSIGRVRSLKFGRSRILKPSSGLSSYFLVALCKNNKVKTISVHRLVATAFIPNPESLPEVDHFDANRKNNCVSNLRWVSHRQNIAHAGKLGHMARSINQHCKWGERRGNTSRCWLHGHIREDIKQINMENKNFESKTFQEIWSALNGEEHAELARKFYLARCCSTYQTLWNWGMGKTRPTSPIIRDTIAKVVGKTFCIKTDSNTLFPR